MDISPGQCYLLRYLENDQAKRLSKYCMNVYAAMEKKNTEILISLIHCYTFA